jgi:hypothetical protein
LKQSSGRARTPRLSAGRGGGAPVLRREGAGLGAPRNQEEAGVGGRGNGEVITPVRRDFVRISH